MYEGLGSIYWHMVSKLLLAVQENIFKAQKLGDKENAAKLIESYYKVRSGLGYNKTPELYGAFPFDPYSHTPSGQGAKQPGMTGQVKEINLITDLYSATAYSITSSLFHLRGTFSGIVGRP